MPPLSLPPPWLKKTKTNSPKLLVTTIVEADADMDANLTAVTMSAVKEDADHSPNGTRRSMSHNGKLSPAVELSTTVSASLHAFKTIAAASSKFAASHAASHAANHAAANVAIHAPADLDAPIHADATTATTATTAANATSHADPNA